MESFLREWRQDALNKAQYESAIFIGDKLLALTSSFRPIYTLFYPVISCLIFILSLSLITASLTVLIISRRISVTR